MTTYEPWIGGDTTTGNGNDCRARWGPGWPPCGALSTVHILSESAIDGVVCLKTCEAHAPMARAAGVYVDEHSPSFPGCRCIPPLPPAPVEDVRRLPYRPEAALRLTVRAPFDPELQARFRARYPQFPPTPDTLVHYPTPGIGHTPGICGASSREPLRSTDWQLVSCPTCRLTEIP